MENKPNDKKDEYKLIELIKVICTKHKRRYGYRRVVAELRIKYQLNNNHKRISRIMAEK
ncbi:transposase [Pelosinus baikalensis]|uniref:Transposase n=1 Tax=Pelosinus baikalensis TaxID=2892015 RepID=A0ABS8HXD0_9FIRM|nr:transposase [Pelosinus baikalensis]